ncbi:hypothetical protein ACFLYG_02320 [Chloroflexota bacterium]
MYLTFIPACIKYALAQYIEIGALLLAGYFVIRFVLGFFIDKKDKESEEVKILKRIECKINSMVNEVKITEIENGESKARGKRNK